MSSLKRPPVPVSSSNSAKRARTTAGKTGSDASNESLKERFIGVFSEPAFSKGITNSELKGRFPDEYLELAPIINALTSESRLSMSKSGTELFYTLVTEEEAVKLSGLDVSAKMVLQVIERAGNMGIWTKDIRIQTNLQQAALNKIFKQMEARKLIKPVKSVTAKAKKLYMLYHLTPSKELTGGVWYSDLEFDHEFISELRTFLMHCVRRLNGGKGVTVREIRDKMIQAKVSRVELSPKEVNQIIETLVYDYAIEEVTDGNSDEPLFISARRVTTNCEFKWWDILDTDFQYRAIRFEDGVVLPPQEPHYHTS